MFVFHHKHNAKEQWYGIFLFDAISMLMPNLIKFERIQYVYCICNIFSSYTERAYLCRTFCFWLHLCVHFRNTTNRGPPSPSLASLKPEAKREKRKVLLMTFSSMPVGVGSMGPTAQGSCLQIWMQPKTTLSNKKNSSGVFCFPLHRDVRKGKDLRLQGLLVCLMMMMKDCIPGLHCNSLFLEPPFFSTATTATAQLTTEDPFTLFLTFVHHDFRHMYPCSNRKCRIKTSIFFRGRQRLYNYIIYYVIYIYKDTRS